MELLLRRPSPFGNETGQLPNGEFEPSDKLQEEVSKKKILVVGAGGLGSEILKNLALSGFTDIHTIDLDSIDLTNLNRQFLFRMGDVNRPKAQVAADFIMRRVPSCRVTAHVGPIQSKDADFYRQFSVVISGLDNVEARRWLNSMLIDLVDRDEHGDLDYSTSIPFLDGGMEGFQGQSRVILPLITSCFECSMAAFPEKANDNMSCTIRSFPRTPEHCIQYAVEVQWFESHDKKYDTDSKEDMTWIYEHALQRANQFSIEGVTYFKTVGVVKSAIPAVASTNAAVAAAISNEAVKMLSFCGQSMNTYMTYFGHTGMNSETFVYGRLDNCPVCGPVQTRRISRDLTLQEFLDLISKEYKLKSPSLRTESTTLYVRKPESLELQCRPNLGRAMGSLVAEGDMMSIADPVFANPMKIIISYLE